MVTIRRFKSTREILEEINRSDPLHPKEFFHKWIPKIYGVEPGESKFKSCAIDLIVTRGVGLEKNQWRWKFTSAATAEQAWKWDEEEDESFPKALPLTLGLMDFVLQVFEGLGMLPDYTSEVEAMQSQRTAKKKGNSAKYDNP